MNPAAEQKKKLGKTLMATCFFCLIIGRLVMRVFFPETQGSGELSKGILFVLIPIWLIGLSGLVLWLLGKVQS